MTLNEHQKAFLNKLIKYDQEELARCKEQGLDLLVAKYKGEIFGIYLTLFYLSLIDYETFNERSEIK